MLARSRSLSLSVCFFCSSILFVLVFDSRLVFYPRVPGPRQLRQGLPAHEADPRALGTGAQRAGPLLGAHAQELRDALRREKEKREETREREKERRREATERGQGEGMRGMGSGMTGDDRETGTAKKELGFSHWSAPRKHLAVAALQGAHHAKAALRETKLGLQCVRPEAAGNLRCIPHQLFDGSLDDDDLRKFPSEFGPSALWLEKLGL